MRCRCTRGCGRSSDGSSTPWHSPHGAFHAMHPASVGEHGFPAFPSRRPASWIGPERSLTPPLPIRVVHAEARLTGEHEQRPEAADDFQDSAHAWVRRASRYRAPSRVNSARQSIVTVTSALTLDVPACRALDCLSQDSRADTLDLCAGTRVQFGEHVFFAAPIFVWAAATKCVDRRRSNLRLIGVCCFLGLRLFDENLFRNQNSPQRRRERKHQVSTLRSLCLCGEFLIARDWNGI